ncbi:Aste57867_21366 [Aphanomyces stellatus]|uniref:Aste57867_21366 protein n=1 Tax=Aphanomyces stellatus TaxID=120398 RepID=A0A485LIL9_9STRA|nr:hypothetical protein As57867_021297 [Aphanomyces stellatus]VFT98038.1 Aste57867_21366 [Aphanomyces stellatus]
MGGCLSSPAADVPPPPPPVPRALVVDVIANVDIFRLVTAFQAGSSLPIRRLTRRWKSIKNSQERAIFLLHMLPTQPAEQIHLLTQLLHARIKVFSRSFMDLVAAHGYLDAVQFLHNHRLHGCTTDAMDLAAKHGHLQVVMFLHRFRTEGCTTRAMDGAARRGHLDVVQFLHRHRPEGCTSVAMDFAAAKGHLPVVRFLLSHRHEGCTPHGLPYADLVRLRSAKHLQWAGSYHHFAIELHRHDRSSSTATADAESVSPTASMLSVKLEPHVPHASCAFAMDWAVVNGHLDVIAYLHREARLHVTTDVLDVAAQNGFHDVVQYLVTQSAVVPSMPCPPPTKTALRNLVQRRVERHVQRPM